MVDADFSGADLRFAKISEVNVLDMQSFRGMRLSADGQSAILQGLGLLVDPAE